MSNDTPTERFDAAGDSPTERFSPAGDSPTERFPAADEPSPTERIAAPSEKVVEERKSRRLITILAIVGGALLVAVLIVLILLLTKGNGTPVALPSSSPSPSVSASPSSTPTKSATPTPTSTPTPSATATTAPPPPPSTDATVDGFTIDGHSGDFSVDCAGGSTVDITLKWSTSNADHVYFGIDTNDASTGPTFSDIQKSGNSDNDFPDGYRPFQYTCGNGSHKYVFTAVNDGNGTKDSYAIKVTG